MTCELSPKLNQYFERSRLYVERELLHEHVLPPYVATIVREIGVLLVSSLQYRSNLWRTWSF